jgi:hypothetical protein
MPKHTLINPRIHGTAVSKENPFSKDHEWSSPGIAVISSIHCSLVLTSIAPRILRVFFIQIAGNQSIIHL